MTERLIAVGFEGSANKIGEGIDRKPRRHHPLQPAPQLYHPTLARASSPVRPPTTTSPPSRRRRLSPAGVDCLCCTRAPASAPPSRSPPSPSASSPSSGVSPSVNHCVAHIEMGRIVTGADDPIVSASAGEPPRSSPTAKEGTASSRRPSTSPSATASIASSGPHPL